MTVYEVKIERNIHSIEEIAMFSTLDKAIDFIKRISKEWNLEVDINLDKLYIWTMCFPITNRVNENILVREWCVDID